MTARYGTFEVLAAPWKEDGPIRHGVIDKDSGIEWETAGPGSAIALAGVLNNRCADSRAQRLADYVAGYEQHAKNMSIRGIDTFQTMLRCFDEYVGKIG